MNDMTSFLLYAIFCGFLFGVFLIAVLKIRTLGGKKPSYHYKHPDQAMPKSNKELLTGDKTHHSADTF